MQTLVPIKRPFLEHYSSLVDQQLFVWSENLRSPDDSPHHALPAEKHISTIDRGECAIK